MATKSILEKSYRIGFVLGERDPKQLGVNSIFKEDFIYDSLDEISYYSNRDKLLCDRLKKCSLMEKYISKNKLLSNRFYSAPVNYKFESDLSNMSLIRNKYSSLDLISDKVGIRLWDYQ